jgi:DNA modification methylase
MFGSSFELIWSKHKHKRDILRHKWASFFGTEHEPQRGRQHPTQKPVRLLEDIIMRYTTEGQVILDPFLGSGTTLIAAQRTGRVVYGCELSPVYCDVILSRFESESGESATLLERIEEASHA